MARSVYATRSRRTPLDVLYERQTPLRHVCSWAVPSPAAERNGATWTVLRPHMVSGRCINSPMNLVAALGTYAAMSKELGVPLRFPGSLATWNARDMRRHGRKITPFRPRACQAFSSPRLAALKKSTGRP
jgi:hypothetical protein